MNTNIISGPHDLACYLGVDHKDLNYEGVIELIADKVLDINSDLVFGADGSGCSVWANGNNSGHPLKWGFSPEAFDESVKQASQDAVDLWNETHGCHECAGQTLDEWLNYSGDVAVSPACKFCDGRGVSF